MSPRSKPRNSKLGHVPISEMRRLDDIRPAPENDALYRPVLESDPEIQRLAASIREHGILEQLLVTVDGYIVSGHRRFVAARLACLNYLPVRVLPVRRSDDPNAFVVLLREHNRQREKSADERLREELVGVDPEDAYYSLIEHREKRARLVAPAMHICGTKRRSEISLAKTPMLAAIKRVVTDRRTFWPLSDRQIHYALLNEPPLKHARKLGSKYRNDGPSYKALTELLTRSRLAGEIPMEAIADPTRPVTIWRTHREIGSFIAEQKKDFLRGYWRDLLQSQPNQIELLCEKNTVEPILRAVAEKFCVPLTCGRGYCSLPPRHAMANRFRESGREGLVLLVASDFDPDGESIAHSFARSLRDDFGIKQIHAIKVALTFEQVKSYNLPPGEKAKGGSSQYAKFVSAYGHNVFELEALAPETLQQIVTEAIDGVLDRAAFNRELDQEKKDAHFLEGVRRTALKSLANFDGNGSVDA